MKRLKFIAIIEVLLWMVLYNINDALSITPYRLSILKKYYLILFTIVSVVFLINVILLVKHRKKKNLIVFLFLMLLISGYYSFSFYRDYKANDLYETKVKIEDVDYYLYSNHKLNDFGFFEVDYYLAHPTNERHIIEGAVMRRHYQEEFLASYPKDYDSFVSSENLGILKQRPKNKAEAQIPNEPSLSDVIPYEEIDNKNIKFRLKRKDLEYAFIVTNRAGNDELIEVYESSNKNNWMYLNSLAETKELYNVKIPKDDLFIFNYSPKYTDGRMNIFISDASFDEMIPVSLPFESATDVYLEDVYVVKKKLVLKSSGPDWNYGNTRSFYESYDDGLTWKYIKTEER